MLVSLIRVADNAGLRKTFGTPDGEKVAVHGLDLTLYEGQIFVLLGCVLFGMPLS